MTLCESMTDRMAPVAHGLAQWTPPESAHLASCPACTAEWRVVLAARRIGDSAAARIDPARVSGRVLVELGRDRRRQRWLRGGLLGLAAAAMLAIVVFRGPSQPPATDLATGAAPAGLFVPLAELESLDETQLEAVLDGLEAPLTEGGPIAPPSLGNLDDVQLERVLRSLEG